MPTIQAPYRHNARRPSIQLDRCSDGLGAILVVEDCSVARFEAWLSPTYGNSAAPVRTSRISWAWRLVCVLEKTCLSWDRTVLRLTLRSSAASFRHRPSTSSPTSSDSAGVRP